MEGLASRTGSYDKPGRMAGMRMWSILWAICIMGAFSGA